MEWVSWEPKDRRLICNKMSSLTFTGDRLFLAHPCEEALVNYSIFFTPTSPFLRNSPPFFGCFSPKTAFPLTDLILRTKPYLPIDWEGLWMVVLNTSVLLVGGEQKLCRALGSCGHRGALLLPRECGDCTNEKASLRFGSFITKCCFLRISTHGCWDASAFPRISTAPTCQLFLARRRF